MTAEPIVRTKEVRDDGSVVEIVVWQVPRPLPPCTHPYKYRLYFGAGGLCRVRYDNERGKGDHRHVDGAEQAYRFVSLAQLLDDFQRDVENWR
ncbi:MAG: toxin-antitoxin system TumE family protein [Ramlibacter sp.]